MDMDLIINAASDALLNVVLAVIALAGAYGVYFIRLGAAKLKEQTAQIKDEAGRKVLEDALDDVVNLATVSVGAMEQTTAKALRDAVKNGHGQAVRSCSPWASRSLTRRRRQSHPRRSRSSPTTLGSSTSTSPPSSRTPSFTSRTKTPISPCPGSCLTASPSAARRTGSPSGKEGDAWTEQRLRCSSFRRSSRRSSASPPGESRTRSAR